MASLKVNVFQAIPNDASTNTANVTTQEVSTVLATMTVEIPQEAVEVKEVLDQAVVEVDVYINDEETYDESDKGNVAQAVLNYATADTANDTTQDVGAVLAM